MAAKTIDSGAAQTKLEEARKKEKAAKRAFDRAANALAEAKIAREQAEATFEEAVNAIRLSR
jgi:hypothetical protein